MPSAAEDWPRITVVTPNLNGADTLRRTLDSVLQQDYPNLEYIVVDGGSSDGSRALLAEYEPRLARVVVGRDRTLYDGVAKGFDMATGEVLAWLNSDDMYEPGILRRVGRYFGRYPRRSVIYFDGTVWKQGWRVPNRDQQPVGLAELLRGHVLYQDNVFFRRRAYEAVGGLDRANLRLAADYDLWLKLAARYRFHHVPEHGSCFRIRSGQLSGDWRAYGAEMAVARQRFEKSLPPLYWPRALPGLWRRKLVAKLRARAGVYALAQEERDWAPVTEAPPQSLERCRCPVCNEASNRLLFSTPDTRFGDRTVRQVYLCRGCEVAFLFPPLSEAESATLHERSYSRDLPELGDPDPDVHSPYRVRSLLRRGPHYRWLGYSIRLVRRFGLLTDDIVPITEAKDAAILEVGCFEGRVLDWYRQFGYRNLYGSDFNPSACAVAAAKGYPVHSGDITQTDWPGRQLDAIILNQLIEHVADPVGLLASLKGRLVPGGRLYLSTPNFDSAWLKFYGPAWAHWHFPFHAFVTGRRGLREMARRAGYEVKWLRTNTPTHWAYMSDQLGVRGLGGYVSHNIYNPEKEVWRRSLGATVFSWLFHDWRGRGDCLHACLVRSEE